MAFVPFGKSSHMDGNKASEMWAPWQRSGNEDSSAMLSEVVRLLSDEAPDVKVEVNKLRSEAMETPKVERNKITAASADGSFDCNDEINGLLAHLSPVQVEAIRKSTHLVDERYGLDGDEVVVRTPERKFVRTSSEITKRKATTLEEDEEAQHRLKRQRSASEKKRCAECKRLGRAKCRVHGPLLAAAAKANGGNLPKGPAFAKFEQRLKEEGTLITALKLAVSEKAAGFCIKCKEGPQSLCPLHSRMHELRESLNPTTQKKKKTPATSSSPGSPPPPLSALDEGKNVEEDSPQANNSPSFSVSTSPSSSPSYFSMDDYERDDSVDFCCNDSPFEIGDIATLLDPLGGKLPELLAGDESNWF